MALNGTDDFTRFPPDGTNTLLKGFRKTVANYGQSQFLGTRDDTQEGRPYVWKNFKEIDDISDLLVRGMIL